MNMWIILAIIIVVLIIIYELKQFFNSRAEQEPVEELNYDFGKAQHTIQSEKLVVIP